MSRPPRAREGVLDAYTRVLIDDGARAATMDATARAAGVSKGGLLYHFDSKDALDRALVERMLQLTAADVAAMSSAPDGPVAAFIRTSVMTDSPIDHAIIAVSRLSQNGVPAASDGLRRVRELWEDLLRPHVADEDALRLVILVGDGLYFNNALSAGSIPAPDLSPASLDALVALVERAASPATSP